MRGHNSQNSLPYPSHMYVDQKHVCKHLQLQNKLVILYLVVHISFYCKADLQEILYCPTVHIWE